MIIKKQYALMSLLLFVTGICIALFTKGFIRSYLGDVLVIMFMFTSVKSFFNFRNRPLILSLLLFSYTTEILQYFHLVQMLNLQENLLARIVIGTTFDYYDLLAYTTGAFILFLSQKAFKV